MELSAMVDEAMDRKSAEVCFMHMFDSAYQSLCCCQVYGGPVELKVIDTTIDPPQVGECDVIVVLLIVCFIGG